MEKIITLCTAVMKASGSCFNRSSVTGCWQKAAGSWAGVIYETYETHFLLSTERLHWAELGIPKAAWGSSLNSVSFIQPKSDSVDTGAWEKVSSFQPPENASLFWGGQCTADLLYEGGGQGMQEEENCNVSAVLWWSIKIKSRCQDVDCFHNTWNSILFCFFKWMSWSCTLCSGLLWIITFDNTDVLYVHIGLFFCSTNQLTCEMKTSCLLYRMFAFLISSNF